MKIKKLNAIFGLLTIAMLLVHGGYEVYAYINLLYNPGVTKTLGLMILGALIIHMALGMGIVMFAHDGSELRKYPKQNKGTIIQRASAIGIIVFLFGHLNAFNILNSHIGGVFSLVLVLIIQALFFGSAFLHVGTSLSKAFITLGLLESIETKKKMDKAVWAILAIAFVVIMIVMGKTYIFLWSMPQQ